MSGSAAVPGPGWGREAALLHLGRVRSQYRNNVGQHCFCCGTHRPASPACRYLDYKTLQGPGTSFYVHNGTSPLLAELAQLPWLETLFVVLHAPDPWPSIPPAWLAPGSFPSLTT